MSHILLPASGDSLVALGRSSSEPDKYDVDSDFETESISLTEAVEGAARSGARRRVRVETAASTSKAAKVAKRENTTSIPSPTHRQHWREPYKPWELSIPTGPTPILESLNNTNTRSNCLRNILNCARRMWWFGTHVPGDREFPPFCHGSNCYKYSELLAPRGGERVVLEYRDPDGKWVADLAVLDEHGKRRFIVEVKAANPATTERPEP